MDPLNSLATGDGVCLLDGRHAGPFTRRIRGPQRLPVAGGSLLHCAACMESQRELKIAETRTTYVAGSRPAFSPHRVSLLVLIVCF